MPFHIGRYAFGLGAALAILVGCGAQSPIGAPLTAPNAAALPESMHPNSELSGEKFSSTETRSRCSSKGQFSIAGTFHASGDASGPFPGTFSARGKVAVTLKTLSFREHFQIRSGSNVLFGFARLPNSYGSPTFACTKKSNGELGFTVINLRYRVKQSQARGNASSDLYDGSFTESFN